MEIVGELINASRKAIATMIRSEDESAIGAVAAAQAEAGVGFIDVNAGTFPEREAKLLQWLIRCVQDKTNLPCCIDSPDPRCIEAAATVHRGVPLINSISLESGRFGPLASLLAGTDWKVIALCSGDDGIPTTTAERLRNGDKLVDRLVKVGISLSNIYLDPVVLPVATDASQAGSVLETTKTIKARFGGVQIICGLSNISYGLPNRGLVNRIFAALAVANGLSSAILDPLDRDLRASITAAEALAGLDPYCLGYITSYREQLLG